MKHINETFTDEEHKKLVAAKEKGNFKNWHDYIMNTVAPHAN